MKLVIVNENNRERIEKALDIAQRRCRSYIIDFEDDVHCDYLEREEENENGK